MASCSKDKSVRLWKPSIKPSCKDFRAHTSAVRSIHISPDSKTLLSASNDKSIKMWMSEYRNKFLSTFNGHTNWVNCARFSLNGLVVSCSEDKTVKLWDPLSNCCIHTFQEPDGKPNYVEFHPNNKCIGICFSNSTIKIYDIRNHKLIQYYTVHSESVNQLSFHPSGNFLISGSSDKTVKVFDLIERRVMYTLEGHEGPVTAVVFSPDGYSFASGGADKMVIVWKNRFDKEILAKPLETKSLPTNEEGTVENKGQRIDARLSFSKIEQPEIEVSSCKSVNSESSESSDENKYIRPEESNKTSPPLNAGVCNSHPEGNNNSRVNDELALARNIITSLKLEVKHIQDKLSGLLNIIEDLENRSEGPI